MASDYLNEDDISWLTQSDTGHPTFDISEGFNLHVDDPVVSLEDPRPGAVELYDGVFAEQISDDETINNM